MRLHKGGAVAGNLTILRLVFSLIVVLLFCLTMPLVAAQAPRIIRMNPPNGATSAVWSESQGGDKYELKTADFNGSTGQWSEAKTVLDSGNPRFPSAVCDKEGVLWIVCSVETEKGREIRLIKN
jgi:hypothetical protein